VFPHHTEDTLVTVAGIQPGLFNALY